MGVLRKNVLFNMFKLKNAYLVIEQGSKGKLVYSSQKGYINTVVSPDKELGNSVNSVNSGSSSNSGNSTDRLKMNDFHYFNIYLLKNKNFVNFVLTYNFCENKNMYVCMLIHLSNIYNTLSVKDICRVLEKIIEHNKASFSHFFIKGETILKLYSHLCNNIVKLNVSELVTLMKCCCYTRNEYPIECIRKIKKVLMTKNLTCLNTVLFNDICNCLVNIRNDFKLRKFPYDNSLHYKILLHLRSEIMNVDVHRFFQILPFYINLTKVSRGEREQSGEKHVTIKHVAPSCAVEAVNTGTTTFENVTTSANITTFAPNAHTSSSTRNLPLDDGEHKGGNHSTNGSNGTIERENNFFLRNQNGRSHSEDKLNSSNLVLSEDEVASLKNNCKLIFLNKMNEINKDMVLPAVTIFKWIEINDRLIFMHICEIFLKNIVFYDSKTVVRFFRKCHSMKFQKIRETNDDGERRSTKDVKNGHGKQNKPKEDINEYCTYAVDKEIGIREKTTYSSSSNARGAKPLRILKIDGNPAATANIDSTANTDSTDVATNLLLNLINERVYHMSISQLYCVTYGIYGFIENMKQFSNLNNLKNNMNLLFSMCVQYITNYVNKEMIRMQNKNTDLYDEQILKEDYPNSCKTTTGRSLLYEKQAELKKENVLRDLNMNIDHVYISSTGVYVNEGGKRLDEGKGQLSHLRQPNNPSNPGPASPPRLIILSCEILLNISHFNISKNHRKIKLIYECINKLLCYEAAQWNNDDLLTMLMCLSNLYFKTNDNYIFHAYKKILNKLEMQKYEMNGHHFNKLAIALGPLLHEENKLIQNFSQFLIFYVENNIVPLRSCVFLLQYIMKNLYIKLNAHLAQLNLLIINRLFLYLKEAYTYTQKFDEDDPSVHMMMFKSFLLLHSINDNTLICIMTTLSIIMQNEKYGSNIKDQAIVILRKIVKYIAPSSFQKFPKSEASTAQQDVAQGEEKWNKKNLEVQKWEK
ncbi:conserved Plasmodium protein, unknown function [Plasmodium malariae]|uniref:Uncharacterized protein n=1 Tax=Plasmodium malariae TaxID=5858 RepID=A0A1A8WNU0_PLAMA|nr:conserved Plasmodium protein, unknown function [Plasmodium malariae]